MPNEKTERPAQERISDVLLFLLAQSREPTEDSWYDAVEDLFEDLDYEEKLYIIKVGRTLLDRLQRSSGETIEALPKPSAR